MNDKTISKEAPENILKCWKLSGTAEQIYSTAWQVNDKYVLKRYEDLETLKKNAEMLTVLHEMGIPVQRSYRFRQGTLMHAVMKDTTCFQRSFREITRLI